MLYYKNKTNGELVPFDGVGLVENVTVLTGATTLTPEDSGKVFSLKGATDGAAIALPAVGSGLNYKFIVGSAFATTDWTVVSTTDVIQGGAFVNSVLVPASDENTISFVATVEAVGDYVELTCDGTNWYVNGVGLTAASITFTAPA